MQYVRENLVLLGVLSLTDLKTYFAETIKALCGSIVSVVPQYVENRFCRDNTANLSCLLTLSAVSLSLWAGKPLKM